MREDELFVAAKELQAPYELVKQVAADGKLPVVNFVAGGISTPADAALVMQLGAEGVFVGSGIFKSEDPARMANAIVQATTHFDNPTIIAEVSQGPRRPDARHRHGSHPGGGAPRGPRLVGRRGHRRPGGSSAGERSVSSRSRAPSGSTSTSSTAIGVEGVDGAPARGPRRESAG